MKNVTVTVFIPNEDFRRFLEVYGIVSSFPDLEANYTFKGEDIRVYEERMHRPICKQVNIPVLGYMKWQYYHAKNSN